MVIDAKLSKGELRRLVFLKDVLYLAVSAFGGPQAHIAMMFRHLVEKRKYLSELELIELQALCQILPGPTSTQTITAIAYKKGGTFFAFITLLVWILPAVILMCLAAIGLAYLKDMKISTEFTRFLEPIAVAFVSFAAYKISMKVIHSKTQIALMIISAFISYLFRFPWLFPILLIGGGFITAREYKRHHKEERKPLKIEWKNLIFFVLFLILSVSLSKITQYRPIILFEYFYKYGSLIFGGGQVLIPYIYSEFVTLKEFLSSEDFLTGFGLVQAMPGPVFSFASYIGAIANKDAGTWDMILGAFLSSIGVFLPGTLLIFFVIKFWDELKKNRIVKASLDGINAVSSGLICAAAIMIFMPIKDEWINYPIMLATFALLNYTKIPAPFLVIMGLAFGLLF